MKSSSQSKNGTARMGHRPMFPIGAKERSIDVVYAFRIARTKANTSTQHEHRTVHVKFGVNSNEPNTYTSMHRPYAMLSIHTAEKKTPSEMGTHTITLAPCTLIHYPHNTIDTHAHTHTLNRIHP